MHRFRLQSAGTALHRDLASRYHGVVLLICVEREMSVMRRVSLSNHHCDRLVSRRALLRAGALTLGGMTLADLLRARAYAADEHRTPTRDTAVILLWLEGGPSHLETYDLKPDAPVEFRGEFAPIATNVTGLDVCEWLPGHARIADRFSLIRSIAHDVPDHRGRPMPILPSGTPIRELNG